MPDDSGGRGRGFLEGITTLVERLAELAETGERVRKTGEVGRTGDKVKATYDVDVRVGGAKAGGRGEGPRVEPEPKARDERPTAAVQPIREPFVDVFDEETGLMVVAQMPGVECREIVLELREDILSVQAEHDGLRYQKELLLPRSFSKEQMHATCRNGVLEIRMNPPEVDAR